MKLDTKWATLALILVLVYIHWSQSRREHACPLANKSLTEAAIKKACDELGGVVQGSDCVCADGSAPV
jgi:hypothetical protein